MNKLLTIFTLSVILFSCGASEKELEQQRAMMEKEIADSIANVYREKAKADSIERAQQKSLANNPVNLGQSLLAQENKAPLNYLQLSFDLDFKVIGRKDIIKGEIMNQARMATFKDIVLQIDCYSGTETLINSYRTTIYEYIAANQTIPFEYKMKSPKGTKTINVKIIDAKPF